MKKRGVGLLGFFLLLTGLGSIVTATRCPRAPCCGWARRAFAIRMLTARSPSLRMVGASRSPARSTCACWM